MWDSVHSVELDLSGLMHTAVLLLLSCCIDVKNTNIFMRSRYLFLMISQCFFSIQHITDRNIYCVKWQTVNYLESLIKVPLSSDFFVGQSNIHVLYYEEVTFGY